MHFGAAELPFKNGDLVTQGKDLGQGFGKMALTTVVSDSALESDGHAERWAAGESESHPGGQANIAYPMAARWLLAVVRSAVGLGPGHEIPAYDSRTVMAGKWHMIAMVKGAWLLGGCSRARDTARHPSSLPDTTAGRIPSTAIESVTPRH
ncbi:hypothetical protein ACTMTF_32715 [Nonomuraea sp. ZG12]|uniref:hypothetical protein n=1 Tax=Nonomuraea sp. ZG12 TaxID=3452207 RepID=UPI003F89157D